MAEISVYLYTK